MLSGGSINSIETSDSINWSWKKYAQKLSDHKVARLGIGLLVGLFVGQFVGLSVGLIVGLIKLLDESTDILQIASPYHRFNESKKTLHFSIFQHKLLCSQLRKHGLLPPDLGQFLDEMSARHILETDGATWRFRHRILQDWFAERWVENQP